jgi:SAM-dependent methyltransferase
MGSPADKIIDLYERHADRYVTDRAQTRYNESIWLNRFAALLPPGGAVLDIGCGCGQPIAEQLIGQDFALDGVDSSPTLIARCRERFPQQKWFVAGMRSLSLEKRYSGILAWDSFFHLSPEDQRGMSPLFKRHAASNAALMFTSGPSHGEAIGSYAGEPLYHASLAAEEYRRLLGDNGFLTVSHVSEDAECSGHTVWLAQAVG